MIRQRALAWAAVLALVVTAQVAPLPTRFSAPVVALAQEDSAPDAGDPTDLAIVALHCAEAPATEALTSFLSSSTPPTGCAPAVGVAVAVTENGDPVPGSPFTTDVAGTLTVAVSLGSAIEVREDPKSLPAGYEPLTQEANGVPYANPVSLDSAVAGAAVLFVNVPDSVATELAQGAPADVGETTDLAVVALHCAEAPATEALTSFFSSGTPPSGCEPAAGVDIAVTENEEPLSGSPFRTDTAGTLAVRVGLGSEITVKEDPKSLRSGYEALTQEVNGVPYANPVQLDSAVAGAAVLFVNLPNSVAAKLNQGTPPVGVGGVTDLASAVSIDRTGCDPAYPDERTCIAPGSPLAEPCSITDQRNFTVLRPDPRGLDTDGDGIGCEPISPSGGTVVRSASFNLYTSSGDLRPAAPARTGDPAVAASRAQAGGGVWVLPPEGSRADNWLVHRDRNRTGLWFANTDRSSTGSLAVVSNPVFIRNGLWAWPNRSGNDNWFWQSRNHDGIWFWPNRIGVGNLAVAASGSGSVAVASNPIFISNGVWAWPDRTHSDDWHWRNRFGNRSWFWPNHNRVGNLTVASSGSGNIAIASNPVVIDTGHRTRLGHARDDGWFWPGREHNDDWSWRNRFGNGIWGWPRTISVGNLAIARSGNGNVAIASNPIFIGQNRNHDGRSFQPDVVSVGNLTIASSGNGSVAIASNPVFISNGVWAWPNRSGNDDWFWRSRNHDGRFWPGRKHDDDSHKRNHFGSNIWGWPSTIFVGNLTVASSGNGSIAIVSNPVFISSGVWHWPGHINNGFWLRSNRSNDGHWTNHLGNGIWGWPRTISVGNLAIARSGNGNVAIVSNPIFISSGVWFVAPDRNHNDYWLMRGDRDRPDDRLMTGGIADTDESNVEPLTINGTLDVEPSLAASSDPATDSSEQALADSVQTPGDGNVAQPDDGKIETLTINDGLAVAPSGDSSLEPAIDSSGALPSDSSAEPPSDVMIAPPTDAAGQTPDAAVPDADYVDPSVDAGYPAAVPSIDPGYVAPDPSYVAPDPNYVEPTVDSGYVAPDPGYVAPDPGYSQPEPSYVEPAYVDPNYVDPGTAALAPDNLAPDPGYIAPEPSYTQPEPAYTPDATYVESGNLASDPGSDFGNSVPDAGYFSDPGSGPGNVDLGIDPGYVDSGNVAADPSYAAPNPINSASDPSFVAPEPSFNSGGGPSTVDFSGDAGGDTGTVAPDPDGGRGKRNRGDDNG